MKIVRLICICLVSIFSICNGYTQDTATNSSSSPDGLTILYFGPVNGVSYNFMDQTFRCVIMNNSQQMIPAGQYVVKCLPIRGLNYTSGNTIPTIPAIPAHGVVCTEWNLSLKNSGGYPLAGAYICPVQNSSQVSSSTLDDAIKLSSPIMLYSRAGFVLPSHPVVKTPKVTEIDKNVLQVTGNISAVQFLRATNDESVFRLFTNIQGIWQPIATGCNIADLYAGEEGQQPWYHSFKITGCHSQTTGATAVITIDGMYGNLAKASVTYNISQNSSSITGTIEITALQDFQCYGIDLPVLWAHKPVDAQMPDGSLVSLNTNSASNLSDPSIAALHTNQTTWGIIAPGVPPISGWTVVRKSSLGQYRCALEWTAPAAGSLFQRCGSISVPFTLFAKSGSASIQDALIFLRK